MWKKNKKCFKYGKSKYIIKNDFIKKNNKIIINNIKINNLLALEMTYEHEKLKSKNK